MELTEWFTVHKKGEREEGYLGRRSEQDMREMCREMFKDRLVLDERSHKNVQREKVSK